MKKTLEHGKPVIPSRDEYFSKRPVEILAVISLDSMWQPYAALLPSLDLGSQRKTVKEICITLLEVLCMQLWALMFLTTLILP